MQVAEYLPAESQTSHFMASGKTRREGRWASSPGCPADRVAFERRSAVEHSLPSSSSVGASARQRVSLWGETRGKGRRFAALSRRPEHVVDQP